MPKTKNALIRQRVLDKCLRSPKNYSMADLMEACNRELEFKGLPPVTAMNTIRKDLEQIEEEFPEAEIVQTKSGRNKFYSYADKDYSIYKTPLKDEDYAQLTQTLMLLSRFEGMPQFEWLEQLKEALDIRTDTVPVVGFDENIDLQGRGHFAGLFQAISNRQVLALRYKNFRKDVVQEFVVHPYYLKQFNRRWFLMAHSEQVDKLSVFAFDRILSFQPLHKAYRPNSEIDFNDYFDDMIGVSRGEQAGIEVVKLWVSPGRWPYVRTKPLHGTQRIASTDADGTVITINVIINNELEQLLLSFGADIKVLEPPALQASIKEKIAQSLKNYE